MKENYEQKIMDFARGKVAGNDVRDNENNVIVARGQMITDDVIDKARDKGQLQYLMVAAASSIMQGGSEEVKNRLREFMEITEGHEADFVRGEKAGRDVFDFQGNIMVHRGDTITDDLVQQAEEDGMLQELVLAVGAPGIPLEEE